MWNFIWIKSKYRNQYKNDIILHITRINYTHTSIYVFQIRHNSEYLFSKWKESKGRGYFFSFYLRIQSFYKMKKIIFLNLNLFTSVSVTLS